MDMSTPPTQEALQQQLAVFAAREAQHLKDLASANKLTQSLAQIAQRINEHPEDLDGTLLVIAQEALQLTGGDSARVWLVDGEMLVGGPGAAVGDQPAYVTAGAQIPINSPFAPSANAVRSRKLVAVDDMRDPIHLSHFPVADHPRLSAFMAQLGVRSTIAAPLGKNEPSGAIVVARTEVRPFNSTEATALAAFAAQAAIAIETARLMRELHDSNQKTSDALEVQRVMANVLGIVAAAPSNLEVALKEIGQAAESLTRSTFVLVSIQTGEKMTAWNSQLGNFSFTEGFDHEGKVVRSESISQIAYSENRLIELVGPVSAWADRYPRSAELNRQLGLGDGSFLAIPLPGDAGPIGSMFLARRQSVHFTESEKSIIRTLSNQAVIAIQNARLFSELQVRNKEINAALEQQTAIAEVLEVIASAPEDLDTVLPRLASAAATLCEADGVVVTYGTGNGRRAWVSGVGFASLEGMPSAELSERVPGGIAFLTGQPVRFAGTLDAVSETYPRVVAEMRTRGHSAYAALAVPLPGNAGPVGAIVVSRNTAAPFADRHVPILETFANQAVIAIENARLIRELRESNREIRENLDTRRVMSEVLSIVASAPTDLNKTMPKIAEAAMVLTQSDYGGVSWVEGDQAFIYVMTAQGIDATEGIRLLPPGPTASIGSTARIEGRPIEFKGSIDAFVEKWPFSASYVVALGISEISSLATPMFGPHGAIGAIVINRREATDFSERAKTLLGALATQAVVAVENARLFKQLQMKTEELEIASRHKSEFLANMSHELRTPLNAIIGYSELLQEECEDLGQRDFLPDLGKIQTAGKHLLTLISGILDLSKVEAGRMTMFLEDFDIATLVHDADAIVRPLVTKNRNSFVIDCPDDIGVMHADLVKVRQVLFNLLSNSAKFTVGGTISLTVGKQAREGTIQFAIRDTGIGMTEEQLGRLFAAFSQANAETSRKYGGTGLGLALSREFCRLMGGDISVESEVGNGSTFTVTLPITCTDGDTSS